MSVTISSRNADGEVVEIELAKAETDKGTVVIRTWDQESDPNTDAPEEDTFNVYDITANAAGSKLVCRGNVLGPDPEVTIEVKGTSAQNNSVVVTIEGAIMGNGTTEYPISADDKKKLQKFVVESKFPLLA